MGPLFTVLKVLWAMLNFERTPKPAPVEPKPEPTPATPKVAAATPEVAVRPPDAVLPPPPSLEEAGSAQVMVAPSETCLKQGWSKSIQDCHPKLRTVWEEFVPWFALKFPHLTMRADYTWRSQEFQMALWAEGRKKSPDGTWTIVDEKLVKTWAQKSKHNFYPSHAVDYIVFQANKPLWANVGPGNSEIYIKCGEFFQSRGITSGAIWRFSWKDYGHLELS